MVVGVSPFKMVRVDDIYIILVAIVFGFPIADCIANVAYCFIFSGTATLHVRLTDVLNTNSGRVSLMVLTTFLVMLVSGFATAMVTEMFLKVVTVTVLLYLVCGLILRPFYLSVVKLCYKLKRIDTRKEKLLGHSSEDNDLTVLAQVQRSAKIQPVAVVGISCRFAQGVNSKDEFWNMLVRGECGIGSYPKNRLEEKTMKRFYNPGRHAPGKHYTLKGAFLDNISGFDAQFFGISPAECRALDPQQRLLLQVVYEATEDAGERLEDLQRCRTGVYVGLMNLDYGRLLLDDPNVPKIDEFASTGITASTVANRISYSLNLTGPSLTVDTACSSSLTALNIAVTHLQTGECDVAIVCAPNLILARYFHTACCKTGLLAQDGRCKSFDTNGDGYGRGEGVAAVVLKRTSLALLDRDDPYAEIVACGLNNDGQNAIPMTGPSDKMQAKLARRVLQESGLGREDIQYVEAHGTGTAIGDVVEMRSVSSVYGNSSARVLRIGSVKSNINHTESTAGLAGLIKVCLMIKRGCFVPTINVHELKPQLMITERKMAVQMKLEPWESNGGALRTAAVCSYGYGGTNGHAIVREIERHPAPVSSAKYREGRIMTLSARSREALKMMAERFSAWIQAKSDEDKLLNENICYTLNSRRTVHSHRLAVTFRSMEQAASLLKMFAGDKPGWEKLVAFGDNVVPAKKLAFIYGGQGTRWYGMAKEMIEQEPTFRESVERIDVVLGSLGVEWCLMEELMRSADESRVAENTIGQTALFALHYSTTELLKSWGISPDAVVGHSLGEISAACAVRALTLKQALQLVLLRSRLHEKCSRTGRMAALGMSADGASKLVERLELESRVNVAVVNSPADVVLSGDADAMATIESHVKHHHPDVFWKSLRTTRAFHCVQMDEIKDSFFEGVRRIKLNGARVNIPFYSTVTGSQLQGHMLSLEHWWRNVRKPVLFCSAVQQMMYDGYKVFVEINAAPQFPRHVHQIWSDYQKTRSTQECETSVITTLPKSSVAEQHLTFLHNCVGNLFTSGYTVSWDKIQGSGSRSFIRCPTYPWQEREFWYREAEPAKHVQSLSATTMILDDASISHPLLGKAVSTQAFSGLHVWESEVDLYQLPCLKDHAFQNSDSVIPGACYVEMALAMVVHVFPNVVPRLNGITFNNLLTLTTSDVLNFRTRLDANAGPNRMCGYQVTLVEGNGNELLVSEGSTIFDASVEKTKTVGPPPPNYQKIDAIKSRLTEQPLEVFNAERAKRGFCYGAQFSLITESWCDDTEALCTIMLTDEILSTSSSYVVHPSIIDACFQSLFLLKQPVEKPVPYRVDNITVLRRTFPKVMFCHVKASGNETEKTCDVTLFDCHGNVVMLIVGFLMADLSNLRPDSILKDVAFQMEWKQESLVSGSKEQKLWLILNDRLGFAQKFIALLPENQSSIVLEVLDSPSHMKTTFSSALQKSIAKIETGEQKQICVVNFLPVDSSSLEPDWKNFQPSHRLAFESSLVLLQTILEKDEFAGKVQLVLVTSGSVSFFNDSKEASGKAKICRSVFPWSSTLFGFRRTLAEELTSPKTTVVDLPENPSALDFVQMFNDLSEAEISEEIAYRSGIRYLNQIKRFGASQAKPTKEALFIDSQGEPRPFKLSFVSGKNYLRETTRLKTVENHSLIEVSHAAPLLQKYWTSPRDRVAVCGKLKEAGSGLVMAVCEVAQLGNCVLIEDRSLVRLDEQSITAREAAALCYPMALFFYIANELIGTCRGKTILVYAERQENACVFASVASSLGATVVCVAKSLQNEVCLEQFGVAVVVAEDELLGGRASGKLACDAACFLSHPRGTALQQVINRIHDGGKVVIVSSASGDCNFNVSIKKNVVIVNTTADEIVDNAQTFEKLVSACTTLLAANDYLEKLKNLRHQSTSIYDAVADDATSHPKSEGQSGFGFHSITFDPRRIPERVEFVRLAMDAMGLRDDRTYLVVGGIRGFGFEVARWMVENGAKTVMCTARSLPSQKKKDEVARLENATKSQILLRQADVTSWEDMVGIEKELQGLPEVAGIVFSAMVLEDQRIKDADLKTCARVVATKVQGSVVLHQLSLSMNLDFFIMFSSITGVIGNLGQLAYSAANSFLDSLCEYRRHKLGLPALSVAWGTMGGAGVLERSKDIANLFKSYGFRLMSCKKGMDFLKEFLCKHPDQAQVVLCDIDWPTYLKSSAYILHASPRLRPIKDETPSVEVGSHLASGLSLEELAARDPQHRKTIVEDFVRNHVSAWIEGGTVDLNLPLYKYGVDSIGAANMSLQIRNGIGALFEIYYFIQPKTNGMAIINGILQQVEHLNKESKTMDDVKRQRDAVVISDVVNEIPSPEKDNGITETEHGTLEAHEKVVPLYAPEDAIIKVFMMHSSHKSALANAPFASGFQRQATVSLYSVGVDGVAFETLDYGSVRSLAERYVKLIKAEQSTGPYYLAGFSFGGTLCFEVASQLNGQDEDVATVIMLDTYQWFPCPLIHSKQHFVNYQECLIEDFQQMVPRRFLKKLAMSRLGYTLEEFEYLLDDLGMTEKLLLALEKRAVERRYSLDVESIRRQVDALRYQMKAASLAHFEWQPPKAHFHGTLTYIQCQASAQSESTPFLWSATDSWKSLTNEMDLFTVPGSHFDLLDQPLAEVCGSLIMSAAAITYRNKYTLANPPAGPRFRPEERLVDWLKRDVDISMSCDEADSNLRSGKLWLNEEETNLTFLPKTSGLTKGKHINLTDIHNIVPAKFYPASFAKHQENLTISLIASHKQIYYIQCTDWRQRDKLMEVFRIIFATPLLEF